MHGERTLGLGMVLEGRLGGVLFVGAQALDSQHGILRPAVAFFLDFELLLPQRRKERVALLDGIETKALREVQPLPVRKLSQQVLYPPFDIGRRFFRSAAKENVVFDLQPADILFEQRQFFVGCHSMAPLAMGSIAARFNPEYTTGKSIVRTTRQRQKVVVRGDVNSCAICGKFGGRNQNKVKTANLETQRQR